MYNKEVPVSNQQIAKDKSEIGWPMHISARTTSKSEFVVRAQFFLCFRLIRGNDPKRLCKTTLRIFSVEKRLLPTFRHIGNL